jgi:hypothetical protein
MAMPLACDLRFLLEIQHGQQTGYAIQLVEISNIRNNMCGGIVNWKECSTIYL